MGNIWLMMTGQIMKMVSHILVLHLLLATQTMSLRRQFMIHILAALHPLFKWPWIDLRRNHVICLVPHYRYLILRNMLLRIHRHRLRLRLYLHLRVWWIIILLLLFFRLRGLLRLLYKGSIFLISLVFFIHRPFVLTIDRTSYYLYSTLQSSGRLCVFVT